MNRDISELRPICITGDPVVCEECLDVPTLEEGRMLVIACYFNGKLTDLKCAKCRGHIKDAQAIMKEFE